MPNAYHQATDTSGSIASERLTVQGNTATSVDILKLPVRFGSATDVFIIFSFHLGGNTTSDLYDVDFIEESGGSETVLSNPQMGLEATNEVRSYAAVFRRSLSADTNYNYGIKLRSTASTTADADAYNPRITVLEEAGDDQQGSSTGRDTTTNTSGSPVAKVTLTFTPGSTGDYLIMGSAIVDGSASNLSTNVSIDVDGTDECVMVQELDQTTYRYPYFGMVRKNLDNTEHNIKLEYWSETSSLTTGIQSAYLIAIRLDA